MGLFDKIFKRKKKEDNTIDKKEPLKKSQKQLNKNNNYSQNNRNQINKNNNYFQNKEETIVTGNINDTQINENEFDINKNIEIEEDDKIIEVENTSKSNLSNIEDTKIELSKNNIENESCQEDEDLNENSVIESDIECKTQEQEENIKKRGIFSIFEKSELADENIQEEVEDGANIDENDENKENLVYVEEDKFSKKKGFFSKLVDGLTKTRNNIVAKMDTIFSTFSKIDDDFYEELEETLIMGDLGVETTLKIIEDLKEKVKENKIKKPSECRELLINIIRNQMFVDETAYNFEDEKSVVLIIGVNGVGKTTSIGKLASQLKSKNKKVILAAADTFRAAAIEQLTEWSNRAGVDIISQQEGSDPAAVVYDALSATKSRNADILICDTAGRLHNKKNLMNELAKINKIIDREYPQAYRETLIVLDGTTGQNALEQARQFKEVANITGIIMTKLDGTAKGGIAIAVQAELGIPVKYIGVGEHIEDLQKFDPDSFVEALFQRNEDNIVETKNNEE